MMTHGAPSSGLWYIGEQCGKDTYMNMDGNSETPYLDVSLFDYPSYKMGQFAGMTLDDAVASLDKMRPSVVTQFKLSELELEELKRIAFECGADLDTIIHDALNFYINHDKDLLHGEKDS